MRNSLSVISGVFLLAAFYSSVAHAESLTLPDNPAKLPYEWVLDPAHRDPNGARYRHPSGDYLDFHRGRPGEKGWKGRDHWHHNGEDDHLSPGDKVEVSASSKTQEKANPQTPEKANPPPLILPTPSIEPIPVPIEPIVPVEPIPIPI